MIADCHMHTGFSSDSDAAPEAMAAQAVKLGMERICITDHFDMDYPGGEFQLDTDVYWRKLEELREQYGGKLEIRRGVELGLQPHLGERIREYAKSRPFDYIIGSVHLVRGLDPYDREQYPGTDGELYREYFQCTLENLRSTGGFQALGHLDYVVRYGYTKEKEYSYAAYGELIDEILRELIHRGIALEINSGGLKYGLGFANPHPDVLRRYRELGGELLTVGSDAHRPEHVGYGFRQVRDMLLDCGYAYYTEFSGGKPAFLKL